MKMEEQIVHYEDKYWSWWGGKNAGGRLNLQHFCNIGEGVLADPGKCRVLHGEEYKTQMALAKKMRESWSHRQSLKEFGCQNPDNVKVMRAMDAKKVDSGLLIRVHPKLFIMVESEIKVGDTVRIVSLDKVKFMIVEGEDKLEKAKVGDEVVVTGINLKHDSFIYMAGGCQQNGYLSQVEKV